MKRERLRDYIGSIADRSTWGHNSERGIFGQSKSGHLSWISQGSTTSFGIAAESGRAPGTVLSSDAQSGCADNGHRSGMTVSDFVERVFVPSHALAKRQAGQAHLRGILKHIVTPRRVDQAFGATKEGAIRTGINTRDWPYLDSVLLEDVRAQHIQGIVSRALECGYSTQTVKHIRSVACLIFALASKARLLVGENPARSVVLPKVVHRQSRTVTAGDLMRLVKVMRYPEKEIALLAALTGMNIGEICGLQWKYVNLSDSQQLVDGESIPARTIAVRKHSYRCDFSDVKSSRRRELPISDLLLTLFKDIKKRRRYASGRDFVLTTRNGTAINQDNIATRRLKEIGRRHDMPWLTWQIFRRSHATLGITLTHQLENELGRIERNGRQEKNCPAGPGA